MSSLQNVIVYSVYKAQNRSPVKEILAGPSDLKLPGNAGMKIVRVETVDGKSVELFVTDAELAELEAVSASAAMDLD